MYIHEYVNLTFLLSPPFTRHFFFHHRPITPPNNTTSSDSPGGGQPVEKNAPQHQFRRPWHVLSCFKIQDHMQQHRVKLLLLIPRKQMLNVCCCWPHNQNHMQPMPTKIWLILSLGDIKSEHGQETC